MLTISLILFLIAYITSSLLWAKIVYVSNYNAMFLIGCFIPIVRWVVYYIVGKDEKVLVEDLWNMKREK